MMPYILSNRKLHLAPNTGSECSQTNDLIHIPHCLRIKIKLAHSPQKKFNKPDCPKDAQSESLHNNHNGTILVQINLCLLQIR